MDRQALKLEKEKFVSGLAGGSISEVNAVTSVALSAYCLWAAIQTRTRSTDVPQFGIPAFLLDAALNSICLLFSITTYSSHPLLLNILLLTPAIFLYFQPPVGAKEKSLRVTGKEKKPKKGPSETQQTPSSTHNPFVTVYRGGMMVITCLAILAVDFKIFPRRFAKTETWGTSLMDLGVGSFVFSSGLVSSRQPNTSVGKQLLTAFRSSAVILSLGIIRMVVTKAVDYQEHVTEYGVHWNFFITLGLLPPFVTILRVSKPKAVPYSTFALLTMLAYEWALYHVPFRSYDNILTFIVSGQRSDLFSQNREGIFSFLGYLSIFLVGLDVGNIIVSSTSPSSRKTKLIYLSITSILSILAYQLASQGFHLQVSRRLANVPYVLWTVSYNVVFLLGFFIVQIIFFPNQQTPYAECVPWTLEAINRNGLTVFLLGNVLTGLINLTINTLEVSNVKAMFVLSGYALILNGITGALHWKRSQTKKLLQNGTN